MKNACASVSKGFCLLAVVFVLLGMTAAQEQEGKLQLQSRAEAPLTNEIIVELTKAGLDAEIIIAKINEARLVDFQLDPESLIALNNSGVKQEIIVAMLERSEQSAEVPVASMVRLMTSEGELELVAKAGVRNKVHIPFHFLHYLDFHGVNAEIRIKDRHPTLVLLSDSSPRGEHYLVKLEVDKGDNTRSVKIGQAGGGPFMSKNLDRPDPDWIIETDVTEAEAGKWTLRSVKPLKRGEYGLLGPTDELYDFGIDE